MAKQTTLFVGQNRFDCKVKEYSLYVDGALCMYISVYQLLPLYHRKSTLNARPCTYDIKTVFAYCLIEVRHLSRKFGEIVSCFYRESRATCPGAELFILS